MLVAVVAVVALVTAACSGGRTGAVSAPSTTASAVVSTGPATSLTTSTEPPATIQAPDDVCRPEQPSLLVVGDSVLQGARSVLYEPLTERFEVTYDALRDRATPVASRIVDDTPVEDRQVVVVGVGYNDHPGGDGYDDLAAELLEHTEGSDLVLWLTLSEARSHYPALNDALADLTWAHPELELVEWGTVADEVDEVTVSDGIHLTGEGAEALAELLLSHLDDWLANVPVCSGVD